MGVFVITQWPLTSTFSVHPPSEHVAEFGEIPSRCSWDSRGWDAMMSPAYLTSISSTTRHGSSHHCQVVRQIWWLHLSSFQSQYYFQWNSATLRSSSLLMLYPQPGLHLMHCVFPSTCVQILQRTSPCCHSIRPASPPRSLLLSFLVVDKHFWTVVCLWSLHLGLTKKTQLWTHSWHIF